MTIPLKQWAEEHGIPYRTALSWVQSKRLSAKKQTYTVEIKTTKRLRGYVLEAETTIPESV